MAAGVGEPIETSRPTKLSTPLLYIALAVVGWVISGYVGYSTALAAMNSRIAVVETKADDVGHRIDELRTELSEMRTDIKTLIARGK